MTGYVADANILIALLDPDNAMHDAAIDALLDIPDDEAIQVHPVNVAEVFSFYDNALVREQRWRALCMAHPFAVAPVPHNDDPYRGAMTMAEVRRVSRQKMPDVCALHLAHHLNATLVTHDARLARAARELKVATLPAT